VGEQEEKADTPEEDVAEISQDYTLSEQGEGDSIGGNKDLRDKKDTEDETRGPKCLNQEQDRYNELQHSTSTTRRNK
jgi:hypothetical protein